MNDMTETTVHIQAANITGDGVEYFVNGNIESITIPAERAKKVFDELTGLREENTILHDEITRLQKQYDEAHESAMEYLRENAALRERVAALEAAE